jgi:hypothetical protein
MRMKKPNVADQRRVATAYNSSSDSQSRHAFDPQDGTSLKKKKKKKKKKER